MPPRKPQGEDEHKVEGYGPGWHVPKEQRPEDIVRPEDVMIL